MKYFNQLKCFTGRLTVVILMLASIQIKAAAQETSESKAESILSLMTLDEKVGQMVQIERGAVKNPEEIKNYFLGSVLSGGGDIPPGTTASQLADIVDPLLKQAMNTTLKIPLIYGIDSIHGFNSIVGTVVFPHNIGMGAANNPQLTMKKAEITAEETASTGIKWAFGPCVAVAQDIRWGRIYESFSEDTGIVSSLGKATVEGLQGELTNSRNVAACAKHYIGDGAAEYGTGLSGVIDQGNAGISEEQLRKKYLPPYAQAVNAGVKTVMVSYSSWNGVKMHMQKYLITDLLKKELNFKGFVVSDYNAILALPGNYKEQVRESVNAGIDMFMFSSRYIDFISAVKDLVSSGEIPISRIDDAVRRILYVKFEIGLFDRPFADRNLLKNVGSNEHREAARECVRQSLVLLKNKNGILPLSKKLKKILVAGKSADNIGNQCGGWTVTWQGKGGDITTGTTVLHAVKAAVESDTKVIYDKSGNAAAGADAAILVIGERPYAEYFGDRENLKLDYEDISAVKSIKKAGIPMVIVLISGRPLLIADELEKSDAFIAAWLPGTEGQGIADIIFGDFKPSGKLPFAWPKNDSQIPFKSLNSGQEPLFPLGYGLSY